MGIGKIGIGRILLIGFRIGLKMLLYQLENQFPVEIGSEGELVKASPLNGVSILMVLTASP